MFCTSLHRQRGAQQQGELDQLLILLRRASHRDLVSDEAELEIADRVAHFGFR